MLVWVSLLVSWLVVSLALTALVAAVYDEKITGSWFNDLMSNRQNQSLAAYQAFVWQCTTAAHLTFVVLLAIVRTWPQRSARLTLLLLLAGDMMLLTFSYLFRGWLTVAHDWGLPEIYQYTKEIGIALGFAWLLQKRPDARVFGSLSILFVWLFIDDAAMYHEIVGAALAASFDLEPIALFLGGVRTQDVGEVLSLIAPALILSAILAYGYRHSSGYGRHICHRLLGLIGMLVFFGVVVDMADHLPAFERIIIEVAHFEDGGEMWVMSVIAAYAAALVWENSHSPLAPG